MAELGHFEMLIITGMISHHREALIDLHLSDNSKRRALLWRCSKYGLPKSRGVLPVNTVLDGTHLQN
jgi:hypothetical protein